MYLFISKNDRLRVILEACIVLSGRLCFKGRRRILSRAALQRTLIVGIVRGEERRVGLIAGESGRS